MPPHLKKSINQAHLENGTYEQIVTHLETELDLNGLEAPDEQQINIVSQHATNINADRPKPTCHYCKKPRPYRNQCLLLKKQREQTEITQNDPGNRNSDVNDSIPDNNTNNNNHINYNICKRTEGKPETVYLPSETCGKTNDSAERCYVGANAANRPLPWKSKPQQQDAEYSITGCARATAQHPNFTCHNFTPGLRVTDRRPPKENSTNPRCCLAAISREIRGEFKLANFHIDCTAKTDQNTHTPELKQSDEVESRASPIKGLSLQNPEPIRNSFQKIKLGANQYCASITPTTLKTEPQKRMTISQLTFDGDDIFPLWQYELHYLGKS